MENENSIQTDELIEPREEYSISLTAEDMKNIFLQNDHFSTASNVLNHKRKSCISPYR